jgi:hypothetical protein
LLECGGTVVERERVGEVRRRYALAGEIGGVLLRRELGSEGTCHDEGERRAGKSVAKTA